MIKADPVDRITVMDAIHHPWLKKIEEEGHDGTLDKKIIEHLANFKGESILRKLSLIVLVTHLTPEQIAPLKREFEKIDTDMSGFIEL